MGLPPDRLEIVDNSARSLAENEAYTEKQRQFVLKVRRGQRAMATQENKPLEPPTWEHVADEDRADYEKRGWKLAKDRLRCSNAKDAEKLLVEAFTLERDYPDCGWQAVFDQFREEFRGLGYCS